MTAIKTINTVSLAKLRFSDAVSRGIEQLMNEGFNRDRSTSIVLNCLRRTDTCPDDKEVFKVIKSLGVNHKEATTALTVASALRQVISTRGVSPTEAINELTDRIKIHLQRHMRHSTETISNDIEACNSQDMNNAYEVSPFAVEGVLKRQNSVQQSNKIKNSQSKSHLSKHIKKANTNLLNNSVSKAVSRRRASKPEDITNSMKESNSRDEANVKIDLVTKSIRTCDDANINRDSNVRNKVSASTISRKRGISAMSEDEHAQIQSPVKSAKRPRL